MKSNKKVPKITPYDVAMINSLISGDDLSERAVDHVLKGNTELYLIAHRLLKKRMRTDPGSFPDRVLITVLGVASDKINAVKRKKTETKKEANGVVQEEKRVRALEMEGMLKEVRAKQRKAQEEAERELEERQKRDTGEKITNGYTEEVNEADPRLVDGIPY